MQDTRVEASKVAMVQHKALVLVQYVGGGRKEGLVSIIISKLDSRPLVRHTKIIEAQRAPA